MKQVRDPAGRGLPAAKPGPKPEPKPDSERLRPLSYPQTDVFKPAARKPNGTRTNGAKDGAQ
jgi:hypothetical protein